MCKDMHWSQACVCPSGNILLARGEAQEWHLFPLISPVSFHSCLIYLYMISIQFLTCAAVEMEATLKNFHNPLCPLLPSLSHPLHFLPILPLFPSTSNMVLMNLTRFSQVLVIISSPSHLIGMGLEMYSPTAICSLWLLFVETV